MYFFADTLNTEQPTVYSTYYEENYIDESKIKDQNLLSVNQKTTNNSENEEENSKNKAVSS